MATTDSTTITRRFAAACGLMPIQYAATVLPAFGTGAVQEGSGAAAHNALQQQLTIFYGGMVMVLDGCAPEKAAELIRLAAAAEGQGASKPTPAPGPGDIQIARNASLRRFLSKRKDRATATAPAPAPAPAPVLDPEPVPFQRKDDDDDDEPQPPGEKKGKLEVSCEEAASTWLALGSPGSTHAL